MAMLVRGMDGTSWIRRAVGTPVREEHCKTCWRVNPALAELSTMFQYLNRVPSVSAHARSWATAAERFVNERRFPQG